VVKIGKSAEETVEEVAAEESKPAKKTLFSKGSKSEQDEAIPHKQTSDRMLKAKQKEVKRAQKEKDESRRVKTADMAKKDNSNKAVILLGSFMTVVAVGLFVSQFILVPLFTPTNTFIFQATEDIEHGEWIEPEMLTTVEVPADGVLPTMVVDTADLDGYASRNILAGEPILTGSVIKSPDDADLEEYLFTAVELSGTPVLQDGAMVNVYVRSGSTVSLLFDEPKRVYANSTISGYTSDEESSTVEIPNLLLTDDEFERYHEALANQEVIVAARLHPDRRPGLVQRAPITADAEQGIIEEDLAISELSDEELAQVMLQYVNAELTLSELQTIDGVDADDANNIMSVIENGGFASLNDMASVVDEAVVNSILEHIVVQLETGGV